MRKKLTCSISAVFTAIALGIATGHAQELEQVTTVFEHAIPNIAGKSLIALVVSYPPGGMKALGSVYGYVSQSGLPAALIDLVYLRVRSIR